MSRKVLLKVQLSPTQMSSLVWWRRQKSYLLIHLVPLCNFRVVWKQCAHFSICLSLKLRSPGKSSRSAPYIGTTLIGLQCCWGMRKFWMILLSGWSWINISGAWLQIKENNCYMQENTCKFSYHDGSDFVSLFAYSVMWIVTKFVLIVFEEAYKFK